MLQIIISTFKDRAALIKLPVETDGICYLIVHQAEEPLGDLGLFRRQDVEYYHIDEYGLTRSRNFGVSVSGCEYLYFMDDDVEIDLSGVKSFFHWVVDNDVDVGTCMFSYADGGTKNYKKKSYRHSIFTSASVSSIEILVRRDSLIKNRINFDEDFGLGSKYPSGEEYVFLTDCIKSGLKVYFVPIVTSVHPPVSSGMDFYSTDEKVVAKREMIRRIFPNQYFFMMLVFWAKKVPLLLGKGYFIKFSRIFWSL